MPTQDWSQAQKNEHTTHWTSRPWIVPVEVRCLTSEESAHIIFVTFHVLKVLFPSPGTLLVHGYFTDFPMDSWRSHGTQVSVLKDATRSIVSRHFYIDAQTASDGIRGAHEGDAGNSSVVAASLPAFKLRGRVLGRLHDLQDLPDIEIQVWCSETVGACKGSTLRCQQ
jgi:hypothetical protein